MTILENVSPDAIVFLQTHKRIWPASQRDALFWSHMKHIQDEGVDKEAHDEWVVCNHSIEHESYPVSFIGFPFFFRFENYMSFSFNRIIRLQTPANVFEYF